MTDPQFIVTGTGRCGTRYMSHLLRGAGIKCGHENIFGPSNEDGVWPADTKYVVDSSWLAAPFLAQYSCPVVHVVRSPLHCIRSLATCLLLNPRNGWMEFMRKYCPSAFVNRDPFSTVARFYVAWNAMIERVDYGHREYLRVRIEGLNVSAVTVFGGVTLTRSQGSAIAEKVSSTLNHVQSLFPDRNIESIHDVGLRSDLNKMSERYGYATY